MVYIYPAIFIQNDDKSYTVRFPDLSGCITEGKTLENAIYMAKDVLAIWLDVAIERGHTIPVASKPDEITSEAGGFVSLIDVDLDAYRRENDTRPIRRTVSLPHWMDTKAKNAGLSLSKVLQDALDEKLG